MNARPLAFFLTDFAREPAVAAAIHLADPVAGPSPILAGHSDADLEEARAEARREGERDGRCSADAALAALRANQEGALAAARADWCRQEADVLSARLLHAFAELERSLAESVAGLLEDVLLDAAKTRMVAEFAETLRSRLRHDDPPVRVTGPQDLLDALRDRLGEARGLIQLDPSAGPDLRAEIDDACLETRLSAWRERVRDALT